MPIVKATRTMQVSALFFAALAVVFFSPAFFAGKVPVFRDLLILVIPLRGHARAALHNAELPLWTSDIFFGAPFLANYQSAVLYPPSAIVYLLPFPFGLSVFLAFHLFVGGVGMTRFLCERLRLGPEASTFGGVVFAFGGFFFSLVPLTNQLEVAAWVPWVLHAGHGIGSASGGARVVRLTLLLFVQMLGGAPEAVLLSLALLFAEGLASSERGDVGRMLARLGLATVVASALAAFQLLPTLEYVLRTDRATALPASLVFSESLTPTSLWQFLVPHHFIAGAPAFVPEGRIPIVWSLYVGMVPFALAAISVLKPRTLRWLLVLAAGVLLAFGDGLPLLPTIDRIIPGVVSAFRYPSKFFLLGHLAIAVLAAHALDGCLQDRSMRRAGELALILVIALQFALRLSSVWSPGRMLRMLGYPMLAALSPEAIAALASDVGLVVARGISFALAGLVVIWLFDARRIRRAVFVATILAVIVVDLLPLHQPSLVFTDWARLQDEARRLPRSLGSQVFHYCTSSSGCLPKGAPGLGVWQGALRPAEDAEASARYVAAAATPDLPILEGIGAVAGTDGLSTRDQSHFLRALATVPRAEALHLLASLGVDRVIGPEPLPDPALGEPARAEFPDRSIWSYPVREPAPRLYLADRVLEASDVYSALTLVASSEFRAGHDAVLIGEEGVGAPRPTGGSVEQVSFARGHVRALANLSQPGLLVVGSSFFPGWEATVDGTPTALRRANGVLSALEVSAGAHDIELRYVPWSFRAGCGISFIAAAGMLATKRQWRAGAGAG